MSAVAADIAMTTRQAIDRDGFVVLRGAIDPDWIAAHRDALRTYIEGHLAEMGEAGRAVGASAASPNFKLTDAPGEVAAFVTDARIGQIAADLLGVEAVRLLHFCGFFKPPSGLPTPWHRDVDFIPLATDRIVTAWIPLVAIDASMGLLAFASGSHRDEEVAAATDYPNCATGPLLPGDVSFHLGGTLHSAARNRSTRMREALAISFYADGSKIDEDRGVPFRAALRAHYFADLHPGDVAQGSANPVVYPAAADMMEALVCR